MTPHGWGLVVVTASLVGQAIALWVVTRWLSLWWLAAFILGMLVGGFIAFISFTERIMAGVMPTWRR